MVSFGFLIEYLKLYFGLTIGMGTILSFPLILIFMASIKILVLLVGIQLIFIRQGVLEVWILCLIGNTLLNDLQEDLRRIGRSCFRFCSLVSVLLWLVMMLLLGTIKICMGSFQCLQDMLSFFDRCWGTFRCLGGSKSSTSFLGPNVIFLCGWWSIVDVLHGIIYASVASRDH